MFNNFFCTTIASLFAITACTKSVDTYIDDMKGLVKVDDNGNVENAVCNLWEFLTGTQLGMTLEDLAKEENLPLDIVVCILQNYVESTRKTSGASREIILENILYEAGYDTKRDGTLKITSDKKLEISDRLMKARAARSAYLRAKRKKK